MYRSISVLDVKSVGHFLLKKTLHVTRKKHFKILYYIYNCILFFSFFFLFTLVDFLNYSTMTFINYTCIYIDLYVFACAHHGLTFFVWQTRLWILQMVCGALITCNNLIFVPCDCSGSVFANLLLPIMLLNINGC